MIAANLSFSSLIESVEGVLDWISGVIDELNGIFHDVDFSILYDWLPDDIQGVISAVLIVLIFLALIGLIKKVILFFG